MLNLVSLVTQNYVQRALPFLQSLERLTCVPCYCVCLGWEPHVGFAAEHRWIHFCYMPRHPSESSTGIMQQGRWLDALPDVQDNSLYMLTDADLIIQRDFTAYERQHFAALDAETFSAGWNAREGDTLAEEAERLQMRPTDLFGDPATWRDIPCFNTGVLVMRARAWKRLRDLYESRCGEFYKLTGHRSRGQWLMCWCLWRLGLRADVMSGALHSHGHFSVSKGVTFREGRAYFGDELVMFRHAF